MIGCSINERMQKALDYKSEEVLILKEMLREATQTKRVNFTEGQRARLARLGKQLTAPGAHGVLRDRAAEDDPGLVSPDLLGEVRQLEVRAAQGAPIQAEGDS